MSFFKKSLLLGLCFVLGIGLLAGCNSENRKADKDQGQNKEDTASRVMPNNIKEESITFGEDAFLLSGTLTTPVQGTSFPCVILVQGSGPQDRDETIGQNAPFRDIAWGLAQQGIASIRYDKRTKTYADHIGENITPKEETIDDVIHALDYAKGLEKINSEDIFILGHGFGGYLMPKIAELTPDTAGYIILGGSSSPLEDLMIRQYDYLTSLDNTITNEEAEFMSQAKAAWNRIKQLTPESEESSSQVMGIPRDYWLYLKDYLPTESLKGIEKPVLILQGEEDYEVNMIEFDQWKIALSDKSNVTLKAYPGLNHLFIMGNGSKSPEEYKISGKVSQVVMDDLANFVQVNSIEV